LSLLIGHASVQLTELGRLALLPVPHPVSTCQKKTGRVGFEMSSYIVQESLGVLLVVAGLMGTVLFVGLHSFCSGEGYAGLCVVRKPAS
jgi:hypothetical protein